MTELIGYVENPSARVQFAQITRTAPGQCALCGNGQCEAGFIDTGLDFEFWGRVYFCANCALEISAVFGFISPDEYADLEAELNIAKFELKNMTEKTMNLEKALAGLSSIRDLFNPDINKPGGIVETPEQKIGSESGTTESEPTPSKSNGDDKPKPNSNPFKSHDKPSGQSGSFTKSSSGPGFLNI